MQTDTLFHTATSWADDLYATQLARTAQYRLAALLLLLLAMILGIAIATLLPLSKTEFIVVHSTNNGVTWVDPPASMQAKGTVQQTESEIVTYITNRESYSAFSYEEQFTLINIMSSATVAQTYLQEQSSHNPQAPIVQLGEEGTKRVTVESVLFIDSELPEEKKSKATTESHKNLAQVNFVVTTQLMGKQTTTPYVALLSWQYQTPPTDPTAKWRNWDGFTVAQYSVTQRNIGG